MDDDLLGDLEQILEEMCLLFRVFLLFWYSPCSRKDGKIVSVCKCNAILQPIPKSKNVHINQYFHQNTMKQDRID